MKRSLATSSRAELESAVNAMVLTPEISRPAFAKERSAAELLKWRERAMVAIHNLLPEGDHLIAGDANNREGKDLRALPSGREIELKSGLTKTDANLGLATVAWAVGDAEGAAILRRIMRDSMIGRRRIWLETKDTFRRDKLVYSSQVQTMNELVAYFNERLSPGTAASSRLSAFARAVTLGYTTAKSIQNYANDLISDRTSSPLLLQADWEMGFVLYGKAFDPAERIITGAAKRNAKRMDIRLQGETSKLDFLLYPNYKNSYHRGTTRIPAAVWVNTPCFHVWINK